MLADLRGDAEYVRILTLARQQHDAFARLLRVRE